MHIEKIGIKYIIPCTEKSTKQMIIGGLCSVFVCDSHNNKKSCELWLEFTQLLSK